MVQSSAIIIIVDIDVLKSLPMQLYFIVIMGRSDQENYIMFIVFIKNSHI